ncbi:MAG: PilZ domain-containing protein [Hyphomicrobiales bacterium]|nr:PilZ domain-containing protein [Hyphomicrobiales bacterium]
MLRFATRLRQLHRSPRFELNYPALIDLDGAAPPLSCVISDISASGARLSVPARHQIPDEVTLLFRRRCRVVRRADGGQVGVEFV